MLEAGGLDIGSEGVQWAEEGVCCADGGASETIVQRQCVRVGAAVDGVERTRAERSSGSGDVRSILAEMCVYVSSFSFSFPKRDCDG